MTTTTSARSSAGQRPSQAAVVRLWPPNPAITVLAVAIGTLLIAALSQVSLPLPGGTTWNGQMLGVLLTAGLIGAGRGLIALMIYLIGGVAWIPWLPGFTTGFGLEQAGPIISIFIALTLLVGLAADNGWLASLKRLVAVSIGVAAGYYLLLWGWLFLLNSSDQPNAQGSVIVRAATEQLRQEASVTEPVTALLFFAVMAGVYQWLLPRRAARTDSRPDAVPAGSTATAKPLPPAPPSTPSSEPSGRDRTAPTQTLQSLQSPAATTAQHRRVPPADGPEATRGPSQS